MLWKITFLLGRLGLFSGVNWLFVSGRVVYTITRWWQLKDLLFSALIYLGKNITHFEGSHIFQMGWWKTTNQTCASDRCHRSLAFEFSTKVALTGEKLFDHWLMLGKSHGSWQNLIIFGWLKNQDRTRDKNWGLPEVVCFSSKIWTGGGNSNIFGMFTPIWGGDPIWICFFRWVGSTTNWRIDIFLTWGFATWALIAWCNGKMRIGTKVLFSHVYWDFKNLCIGIFIISSLNLSLRH